jgi:carbon-monoxide dehydrogenase iron sulfur subunit
MKTVFVHPERCIGCKQCEIACAVAHSQSKSLFWAVFESPLPTPRIHAEPGLTLNTSFPNKCRHCNPAPCMGVCPTGAIYRAEDFPEIVLIDVGKCIACGMCAMVCPFDVIVYRASQDAPHKETVAIKCTHCIERQRQGQMPACVEVCKVGALEFGEINELVKRARTRLSEAVSVAVSRVVPSEVVAEPASITAWRTWGAAVTGVNAAKGQEGG